MRPLSILSTSILPLSLITTLAANARAQTETLPAISREVYRQQLEGPPTPAPRVIAERTIADPTISPVTVVPDRPAAVVVPEKVVVPQSTVVAPVGTSAFISWPTVFAQYRYGFNDDGNADDNWYYDFYEIPAATTAVAKTVVKPTTDATPGFRTSWKYDTTAERGLFSW